MFSKDELSKLKMDTCKYKCKLSVVRWLRSYEDMVFAHDGKIKIIKVLASLIKEPMVSMETEHYAEKKKSCVKAQEAEMHGSGQGG